MTAFLVFTQRHASSPALGMTGWDVPRVSRFVILSGARSAESKDPEHQPFNPASLRIGQGFDAHALVEGRMLILGGVDVPHTRGLLGHSDADVLAHAIADALLGGIRGGDIGKLFPDTDPAFKDADSLKLLAAVADKVRAEGYAIDAATNRGYRLSQDNDLLSPAGIERFLPEGHPFAITVRKRVDSTNAEARRRALEGAPEGTVIVAEEQWAGRGRPGKRFFSPAGSGVYLSVVLKPRISADQGQLITCAAALDAGAVSKNSTFYCGESISVAGTRFHCANHKRHGSQTVTQALENSCNQSFIQIGARLGKEAFCDYFAAFGLREPTGVDLPAEPKKSLYYTADRMGPVELASCAFGQSSKISYMEMAAAVCAVVNGGRLMQPYLVSDILNPDGSILQHTEPVCRRQVIKPETSETMREMMEAVVLYGGGRNARIQGYRVGGKSGTSQKLDSADEKARIASFVAVAPIDDPQFLCLVCLDEPHSWTTAGGSLSAPVCAEVLEQTLVYKSVPRAVEPESDPDPAQTAADLPADGDSFDGA